MKNLGYCLTRFAIALSGYSCLGQSHTLHKEAEELVKAEQEFAKQFVDHTIKEAFMKVLMNESVVFRPHPVNGRWAYRIDTRPDTAYLYWKPELVAVSAGGDFGYSTGPWFAKKSKHTGDVKGFGNFVTIWKKDENGTWRVILDKGVNYSVVGQRNTTLVKKFPKETLGKIKVIPIDSLLQIDSDSFAGRERQLCTEETIFFRHHQWPASYTSKWIDEMQTYISWEPINGEIAPFGDMAYSYGSFRRTRDQQNEDGYYLRIWNLQDNRWKILVDLRTEN